MSANGSIILIVDDAGLLPRVRDALVGKGYDILYADNEEDAKDYLKRGSFMAAVRVSEFTFDDAGFFLL